MRRYARTLILITVLAVLAGLALGFQTVRIGGFQRGGDTPLGLTLGLDLQGGSHLVYKAALRDPDTGEPVPVTGEQMEALRRTIERRVNTTGLGEPVIQILGEDRLLVQLPGVEDLERAKQIIGTTARLEFKHRRMNVPRPVNEISASDIVGVSVNTYTAALEEVAPPEESTEAPAEGAPEAQASPGAQPTPAPPVDTAPVIILELTEQGAQTFAALLDEMSEDLFQALSVQRAPSRLEISIEGASSYKYEVLSLSVRRVGESNKFALPFPQQYADDGSPLPTPDLETARSLIGDSPRVFFTEIQGAVDENIGLTGEDLARAFPGQHYASGRPIVNIEFNDRGTRIFGELTTRIARSPNDAIAIFLDDQELIAPVVESPITSGTAFIQGNDFTIQRVRDLSLLLESGRLPVPIEREAEHTVDAILGSDSLAKSVVAGLVGLGMVMLFMTLYYRVPGVMASLALIVYAMFLLALFKILPVTLTLSGVAAAILSIGMAVDANVLIFERMKDELRAGRTLMSAINIGFNRAWPAIRDSSVSTLITSAILFWFASQLGTTVVQGFAITLSIGVLISLFTAITVSRTFLRVVAVSPLGRSLSLFAPSGDVERIRQHAVAAATQRS